jgi:uncharacterized protein (TIGR03086 family)
MAAPDRADGGAALTGGVGLLERAIGYALGSVVAVTPQLLARPTPCSRWDLRALLCHVNDSLAVLYEGVATGCVGSDAVPTGATDPGATDPAVTFRRRAGRVLAAWTAAAPRDRAIAIGDCPLTASIVAGTGAVEIAAHGWDVSRACGQRRPIPPGLALDLLDISRLLVTDTTRDQQFAPAVIVSPRAAPGDRLVAFLGRRP